MTQHPAVGGRRLDRQGLLLDLITGTETDLDSVQKLSEAAAEAMSGLAGTRVECAVLLQLGESAPVSAGTDENAVRLANLEGRDGDGPITHAVRGAAAITVDGGASFQWQAYLQRLAAAGYERALAVPLRLDGPVSGALLFLARTRTDLGHEVVSEANWFAGVASHSLKLALEVHSVRSAGDNLKAVLESRTSIDVACGVIMAQNRCSYPDAFGRLAGMSRQRNLKVRSVAENILKALPSGSPASRFEPSALA
ncbi:ANTAR domain-containing protein [Pseudarthrobacter sp. NamB4]|uniref:ANTAR domain-containing protein n=1 Tax=Pseudarthrobacter sp. NamB4 TaxID=2576837 RepID=UPI001F0DF80D|nr:ANTAR domain-containing protein [Pseudarthrobacter sp. NamB4]